MIFHTPPPPVHELCQESIATVGEMWPEDSRAVIDWAPYGEPMVHENVESSTSINISTSSPWMSDALKKVSFLGSLDGTWHDSDAEAPDTVAVSLASQVLAQLATLGIEPADIDASVDGGICISFAGVDRRSNIECFNSGEILGAMVAYGQEPTIWEITGRNLSSSAAQIYSFLNE